MRRMSASSVTPAREVPSFAECLVIACMVFGAFLMLAWML